MRATASSSRVLALLVRALRDRSGDCPRGLRLWYCGGACLSFVCFCVVSPDHCAHCLKVVCPARLPLSWPLAGESRWWWCFVCACWHFRAVSLFHLKSGVYEAKRKPGELTTVLFLGSSGLWPVCLFLSTFQSLLLFVLYVMCRVLVALQEE